MDDARRLARATLIALRTCARVMDRKWDGNVTLLPSGDFVSAEGAEEHLSKLSKPVQCAGFFVGTHLFLGTWAESAPGVAGDSGAKSRRTLFAGPILDFVSANREFLIIGDGDPVVLTASQVSAWVTSYSLPYVSYALESAPPVAGVPQKVVLRFGPVDSDDYLETGADV